MTTFSVSWPSGPHEVRDLFGWIEEHEARW